MSDLTFEQRIQNAVTEKLNDGTFERLLEQKLEEAIKKSLDDTLGYFGDSKKLIDRKLNEVMVPVIENHDFNKYLIKLDEALTSIINQTSLEDNKKILENFKELMREPEIKEIKLSEIFKRYCEHVSKNVDTDNLKACCEDGEPYYEHVTANMDVEHVDKSWFNSSFDDCYVKFTCDEDEDLNCQIKLYKGTSEDKWKILSGIDSIEINSLRNLSDFEVFLSVLQRGYVEIILDTESEVDDDIEPEEKPEWSLS